MAELADAQDLGSCGDSVWVQVPLPAPASEQTALHSVTGHSLGLRPVTSVPLRSFFLSNPNPLRWASDLFFMGLPVDIRSSFQNRSRSLRFCGCEGFVSVRLCILLNTKPEAWGLGWCVLGFAAVIFFDCSEEGFAVFGGLDFADAGDVQELVHVPGRAGGHVHEGGV